MRLTLYIDIYPWTQDVEYVCATTRPSVPVPDSAVRYRFSIDVPDPKRPDVDLGEVPILPVEGGGE